MRQTYEALTPGSALREAFQGMAARRLGSSSVIIPPGIANCGHSLSPERVREAPFDDQEKIASRTAMRAMDPRPITPNIKSLDPMSRSLKSLLSFMNLGGFSVAFPKQASMSASDLGGQRLGAQAHPPMPPAWPAHRSGRRRRGAVPPLPPRPGNRSAPALAVTL